MEELYAKTTQLLPIVDLKNKCSLFYNVGASIEEYQELAAVLQKENLLTVICDLARLEAERKIRHSIAPTFWERFISYDDTVSVNSFSKSVFELHQSYWHCKNLFQRIQSMQEFGGASTRDEVQIFLTTFKASLLATLPIVNFDKLVYAFYNRAFQVSVSLQNGMEEDDEMMCKGCHTLLCECRSLMNNFAKTNSMLLEMDILDRISGHSITILIQEKIESHVSMHCIGCYDKSHILELEKWLRTVVLAWLTQIYNKGSIDIMDPKIGRSIQNFQLKLNYSLYEIYAKCIIDQFFNIIIDFPDSQPAVDDLIVCLEKLDLRAYLVNSIKKSLETRLLHPGVDTGDILTGYVATIKTLKHLDKSGVLLQSIEPVKEYLRNRNDTVRCVVSSLIEDDGPTDLADELAKSDAVKPDENGARDDMSKNWENWKPDSVECELSNNRNRPSDIISMVVDIYGSKELFVIEYRNLLAERLLMQLDFSPEKEIRNLELLKLRFGETLLHSCEVMLKDISDSKRINAHIQSEKSYTESKAFDISALILSSQFWPLFKKETMEIPEPIKKEFDRYTKQYEAYKGNRTLCWTPINGKVTIEIELNNRNLELIVTPTQAVIIYHFGEKSIWCLEELAALTNIPPSLLKKRIAFWQTQGLIRESSDGVFELIESDHDLDIINSHHHEEDDEIETAMASSNDQREEELQVFWSYIVGMLTNLDNLPLERIHQMLKMFASQGSGSEFSQDELKTFLQRKVREHKLVFTGGVYQLPKS